MNLKESLDELRAGILRDASTLKSGPPDHYWSDARLVGYINEAHKRFARQTFCIRDDSSPAVTQITLATGVDKYTLHKSVLNVISARHTDDNVDLGRSTHVTAQTQQNAFTETFAFALAIPPGKPTRYSTDEGMNQWKNNSIELKFYGAPDDSQVGKIVYLRTIRVPFKELTLKDLDEKLEIPEDYHFDCLEWAAYLALRNWDIDGEDREKADKHKARFKEAVRECIRDVRRKTWAPLMWQFGGNGFTYQHN